MTRPRTGWFRIGIATAMLACTFSMPAHAAPPQRTVDADDLVAWMADHENAGNQYTYPSESAPDITWATEAAPGYTNSDDCSTFFELLMTHAYGIPLAQMKTGTASTQTWPQAADWYNTVLKHPTNAGLPQVTSLKNVQVGDMIFVRDLTSDATGDTGHVMMFDSLPTPLAKPLAPTPTSYSGTARPAAYQWEAYIIDSSADCHGTDDSRYHNAPGGSSATGVGRASIRLYTTNANGTGLAGWTWSTEASKTSYKSITTVPFVIASPNGYTLATEGSKGQPF